MPGRLLLLRPLGERDFALLFTGVPVSLALAGPAAAAFGVKGTMIAAGVLAAVVFVAFLAVPGVRDPEGWDISETPAEP